MFPFSPYSTLQSEKIVALTAAANVPVEPIWATLLAKALEGKDVKELLTNVGSGGGAPAAVAAPSGGAAAGGAAAEEKAEEKKEEEKEESDGAYSIMPKTLCGTSFADMNISVALFLFRRHGFRFVRLSVSLSSCTILSTLFSIIRTQNHSFSFRQPCKMAL